MLPFLGLGEWARRHNESIARVIRSECVQAFDKLGGHEVCYSSNIFLDPMDSKLDLVEFVLKFGPNVGREGVELRE